MKSLPLSKIKKKPLSYFRTMGAVKKGKRKRDTIEYIVRKSFEALPKNARDYISDSEEIIKALTNIIISEGNNSSIQPYKAFTELAKHERRKSGDNTKQFVWNRFKTEQPSLYAKFNSYMYRNGYSARNYWFDNVAMEQNGSIIDCYCELPGAGKNVQYYMLEINYDFSGQDFNAYLY